MDSCHVFHLPVGPNPAAAPQQSPVEGIAEMAVNPNPVNQLMRISLQADASENATLTVTDLTGKRVINKPMTLVAGLNNLVIPVSQLSSGTYIVTVRLSNQTLVKKINKL